jgi:hypothetical protein
MNQDPLQHAWLAGQQFFPAGPINYADEQMVVAMLMKLSHTSVCFVCNFCPSVYLR